MILVKDLEPSCRNRRAVRNAIFFQVVLGVADKPPADVRVAGGGIVQFDGVFERRVGVAEHLVHDHIRERKIIAFTRRNRRGEAGDIRRAVRKSALRNAGLLRTEADGGDERPGRRVEADGVAGAAQPELHVVGPGIRVIIGLQAQVATGAGADE